MVSKIKYLIIASTLWLPTLAVATSPCGNPMFSDQAVIQDKDGYTNVRARPTAKSQIVEKVLDGQRFHTFKQKENWWMVCTPEGQIGYMYHDRVRTTSNDSKTLGCTLENNKVVTLTDLDTFPTYRYGTPQKNEITLSAQSEKIKVYKGSLMFSGGGSTYVRFVNGPYSYVAYSGMGKGWMFDGLIVYKGTKAIMHSSCKDYNATLIIYLDEINAPNDPEKYDFGGAPF